MVAIEARNFACGFGGVLALGWKGVTHGDGCTSVSSTESPPRALINGPLISARAIALPSTTLKFVWQDLHFVETTIAGSDCWCPHAGQSTLMR
jgi:hypothetical protein